MCNHRGQERLKRSGIPTTIQIPTSTEPLFVESKVMPRTAREVLDQEYLQIRAKILELAAFFDRLSEAEASDVNQEKLKLLQAGCRILDDAEMDKAARVQMLFSRTYDGQWREKFSV